MFYFLEKPDIHREKKLKRRIQLKVWRIGDNHKVQCNFFRKVLPGKGRFDWDFGFDWKQKVAVQSKQE